MLMDIINKLLTIIFVLSLLNVFRHTFFTLLAWTKKLDTDGRYVISQRSLLLLGLSLAYVITSLLTGINL
jgi:hypothetical protein